MWRFSSLAVQALCTASDTPSLLCAPCCSDAILFILIGTVVLAAVTVCWMASKEGRHLVNPGHTAEKHGTDKEIGPFKGVTHTGARNVFSSFVELPGARSAFSSLQRERIAKDQLLAKLRLARVEIQKQTSGMSKVDEDEDESSTDATTPYVELRDIPATAREHEHAHDEAEDEVKEEDECAQAINPNLVSNARGLRLTEVGARFATSTSS